MKKLYKAIIKYPVNDKDFKERIIYVASDTMIQAATIMEKDLAVDDELMDINHISDECHVG